MRFLLYVWMVLLLCLPGQAAAEVVAIEKSYFFDPSQQISFEELPQQTFLPYSGVLTLGYPQGIIWVKIKAVDAPQEPSGPDKRWYLRTGPFFLEHIDLYQRVGEVWQIQNSGMRAHQPVQACPVDLHCFELQTPWQSGSEIYLRVHNQAAKLLLAELESEQSLYQLAIKHDARLTASITIATVLLIVGLTLLWHDRSMLFLTFSMFEFAILFFQISNSSLLLTLGIDGTTLSHLYHMAYGLRMAASVLLGWSLLHNYNPPRTYVWGIRLLLLICLVNVLSLLTGYARLGLFMNFMIFFLNSFVQFYGTYHAKQMDKLQRRFLLGCYLFYICIVVLGSILFFSNIGLPGDLGMAKTLGDWRWNGVPLSIGFLIVVLMERSARKKADALRFEHLRAEANKARLSEERLQERHALIDLLTHELKNPLGTVRFALASLRIKVESDPESAQRIQRISTSVMRMDELLGKVAQYNQIESSPEEIPLEPLLVAELVEEALSEYPIHPAIKQSIEPGLLVMADRHLLMLILENLITNAGKYALPGSTAHISAHRADDHVEIQISNEVAPDRFPDESQLFTRYYRHPAFPDKPGMGLGLNLVKLAAQKMQGQVRYTPQGAYVVFTVTLASA